MKSKNSNKPKYLSKGSNERELVMYDSDVHTYDDAIDAIWVATGHNELQCEQLALMIDSIGYATIKIGSIDELQPMAETIELEGFMVAIY
jgi:ATP-dependent Clp protease adaptor protein ClpS